MDCPSCLPLPIGYAAPVSESLTADLPVFQTPCRDDDQTDRDAPEAEVRWICQHSVNGIVMAMVSETLRLSSEERRSLAEMACEIGLAHGPVIISVGGRARKWPSTMPSMPRV